MGTVELLQGFFRLGASAALVVDSDGNILGEDYGEDGPVEGLREALAYVVSVAGKTFAGFDKGPLERQQVHFDAFQLYIESLNGECWLVLVLGANANLGRIRVEIRRTKQMLEKEIAAN